MASKFPPFLAGGREGRVVPFTPDVTATFGVNALVYYDTSTQTAKVCGADPSLILGIALAPSASKTIYADGKVPILALYPDCVVGLSSTSTPAETNVGVLYGIAADSGTGFWQLDTGDTSATRAIVVKVDIANGIFFVSFIAANLQLDAIAS